MRILVASVVLLAGCDRVFLDERHVCYGLNGELADGLIEVCLGDVPERLDAVGPIDTGSGCTSVVTQKDPARTEVCVLAATNINISASLRVTGRRPLALFATEVLLVTGTLDASSRRIDGAGPGGGFAECAGAAGTNDGNGSGGGGAGGSLGSRGGNGGQGASGGDPGIAIGPSSPGFVRGGCSGGDGGASSDSSTLGGAAGIGGGAVYLIAGTQIEIRGAINVSGQGGGGGLEDSSGRPSGGGGGGSGGLIGLDAPAIAITSSASLIANGGGGGGGGNTSTSGGDGGEANLGGTPPFGAAGGLGGASTNEGGAGADRSREATAGGSGEAGGGGGGGLGVIVLYGPSIAVDPGAELSPAL